MSFGTKLLCLAVCAGVHAAELPQTVHFSSGGDKTKLTGYLFLPSNAGSHPAIVLMHGRAGPYSSLANGVYTSKTLSKRHIAWGNFWAERGYAAVLVDSFGPRGYPGGFPRGSYDARPAAVSEQSVRPYDAYGALKWLRARHDVDGARIGLQGWSNGGMAALVSMSDRTPGIDHPSPDTGFRAGLALYPGCGMDQFKERYVPYAPLLMLVAGADEEVSPERCEKLADHSKKAGGKVTLFVYPGAAHNFDDPSRSKQSVAANEKATKDAFRQAERFFHEQMK